MPRPYRRVSSQGRRSNNTWQWLDRVGEGDHPGVGDLVALEPERLQIPHGPTARSLGECLHPVVADVVLVEEQLL